MTSQSRHHWILFSLVGILVTCALSAGAYDPDFTRPIYASDGRLKAPSGYRSWVFVGADLSPAYKKEGPASKAARPGNETADQNNKQFHNIYINRGSYDSFVKEGKFPDPTLLVMEVFRAESKDPKGILSGGLVEAERVALEVAVKDTHRPGGGVPWAYYTFNINGKAKAVQPASAHADKECYSCHLQHASNDNVWVQFYPALRDPE
jgi:hypothetical protein